MATISSDEHLAHGLTGSPEEPDWPRLTLPELTQLATRFPAMGNVESVISHSPRPFSAASLIQTSGGQFFVKRHAAAVRDREGLLEEHRFIAHLRQATEAKPLIPEVLADTEGETAISLGDWTYEVHAPASGADVYQHALSWTPFLSPGHARSAGRALAQLHQASAGYAAPARKAAQLVSSFSIFAPSNETSSPSQRMEAYLASRPALRAYAEARNWPLSMDRLLMPLYEKLAPWLTNLQPLWTHNDLHASNITWTSPDRSAQVCAIIDFGLADRTNAVHDLATAIERNAVEWLRMDEPGAKIVHIDQVEGLLAGYEEHLPLSYRQAQALAAMLPLVHCEFALSETQYFLSILHSKEKAALAYEGYFLGHAEWFLSSQGKALLHYLKTWADGRPKAGGSHPS
jgi:Ser/Thr protein kinase RdoA (MazF antagonist)